MVLVMNHKDEARSQMVKALYELKEKIKTAHNREMIEAITDSMLDIYTTLVKEEK